VIGAATCYGCGAVRGSRGGPAARRRSRRPEPSAENVSAVATRNGGRVTVALRLGAQEVHLVCLEKREEMPAALERLKTETEASSCIPASPETHDGKDAGDRIGDAEDEMGVRSESALQSCVYEGSETLLECDTIIMAVGQAPNLIFSSPKTAWNCLPRTDAVNPQTLMTSQRSLCRRRLVLDLD